MLPTFPHSVGSAISALVPAKASQPVTALTCQRLFSGGAPAVSTMQSIMAIPKTYPLLFGACFTSGKTCLADFFVQTYVEGKALDDVDWKRTSVFMVFGFFYMGIAQYYLYVELMAKRLYPNAGKYAAKSLKDKMKDIKGTKELFAQVAIDQIIHVPFVFYPCYYLTKCAIMEVPAGHEDQSLPELVWYKWTTNFVADVKTSWMIWIPCNTVNFGMMPMHFRVPFMAVCSFGFCLVLSITRGGAAPELTSEAKAASKAIAAELGNTSSDKITALIRKAINNAHLDENNAADTIDFASFKKVLTDCGVVMGDALLLSVFNACDRDGSGGITGSELSTLLFAFHGSPTMDIVERCGFIFDTIDIDSSATLEFHEIKKMLKGLLAMRETLLVNGGDMSLSDSMDALASASGPTNQKPRSPEKIRAQRLKDLKAKYKHFRAKDGVTLNQILDFEAGRLSQTLMAEADVEISDNKVSKSEFLHWVQRRTKASKQFVKLFEAFTPILQ